MQFRLDKLQDKLQTLSQVVKQAVRALLVEFDDIFARHRFDIGINKDFKVQIKNEHTRNGRLH